MPPKTVFVVDDSEIVLDVVRLTLESAEYHVETMTNWTELDERLQQIAPDLVLIDVRMPDAYGDTALMFFKETRGMVDTPFLLFSDLPVDELKDRASECQADGFVSKSWGGERLIEEVTRHLP